MQESGSTGSKAQSKSKASDRPHDHFKTISENRAAQTALEFQEMYYRRLKQLELRSVEGELCRYEMTTTALARLTSLHEMQTSNKSRLELVALSLQGLLVFSFVALLFLEGFGVFGFHLEQPILLSVVGCISFGLGTANTKLLKHTKSIFGKKKD